MIHAQDYIPQQRSVISFIVLNLTEDQVSQVRIAQLYTICTRWDIIMRQVAAYRSIKTINKNKK